jgi:thymidylate synthase (FAD)
MRKVEPKAYLIAYTQIDQEQVKQWLSDIGGLKVLDHITGDDGECLIELAGRNCYKSFDVGLNPNISKIRTSSEGYHANILKSGHGSVLEHATATFAFENVSRVVTHEMVRHRAGTGFSQESLRYIRLEELKFWIPEIIAENDEAMAVFERVIQECEDAQNELARIFDIQNMKNFHNKKLLTSAFRRIAPIGLATGIVVTFNLRALRWIIQMRTAESSEIEIRKVFCDVYRIAKDKWSYLFQDFEENHTDDGLFEARPGCAKV